MDSMIVMNFNYNFGILKDGELFWQKNGRNYKYKGPFKYNQKHGWGKMTIKRLENNRQVIVH